MFFLETLQSSAVPHEVLLFWWMLDNTLFAFTPKCWRIQNVMFTSKEAHVRIRNQPISLKSPRHSQDELFFNKCIFRIRDGKGPRLLCIVTTNNCHNRRTVCAFVLPWHLSPKIFQLPSRRVIFSGPLELSELSVQLIEHLKISHTVQMGCSKLLLPVWGCKGTTFFHLKHFRRQFHFFFLFCIFTMRIQ